MGQAIIITESPAPASPPAQPNAANTGGAKGAKRHNLVTFTPDGGTRVFLKLDGTWTRRCGLAPDINHAVLSYVEFSKLTGAGPNGPMLDSISGAVEFWYTATPGNGKPDVTLQGERLIAVGPLDLRKTPSARTITVEYRLYFADFRERYVEPRGGRLRLGVINKGPKLIPQSLGAGPNAPEPQAPEMTLRQLIQACLDKMGMSKVAIPGVVDGIDAPRDIKWFGNHAPTELKKLLDLAHIAFVPELNGTATLQAITNVGTPALPDGEAMPEQRTPQIDRRGKYVVFSSYPRRVIRTATQTGSDWTFVIQNKFDQWVPINSPGLFAGNITPLEAIKKFATTPDLDEYSRRALGQLYACIQAPQSPTAAVSPVLARRIEADLDEHEISVEGTFMVQNPSTGYWANSVSPIKNKVLLHTQEDVLMLDRRMLLMNGSAADPTQRITGPASFTVRYSYEDADEDAQGNYTPRFFHVGFSAGVVAGVPGVTQMSDDDTENAIDGNLKDTLILTRPQWRMVIVDGKEINRSDITALAKAEAAYWLKDATQPARVLAARGFANVSPSGLVTEVQWDQGELKTTLKLADWYVPDGALEEHGALRRREAGGDEAYPNQATTELSRTSLGESGATQPVLPVQPSTLPAAAGLAVIVRLALKDPLTDPSGNYLASYIQTPANAVQAVGFPAGNQDAPQTCFVLNSTELFYVQSGTSTQVHLLDLDDLYSGTIAGVDEKSGKTIVLINAPIPLEVNLTLATGSSPGVNGTVVGAVVTNATYTYVVSDINGNILMLNATPQWNRPQGILTGPATKGLIYFDESGVMQLGQTDEQGKVVGCG